MEKPKEKDFNLSKVKLLPTGGLKVEYQLSQSVDSEVSVVDRVETVTREVHPDLLNLFDDLASIVARVFGMTAFLTLFDSGELGIGERDKTKAREFAAAILDRIEVRGVSWSGQEDSQGVVLTAVYETSTGLKTAINTPRIKVAQISYGFEEELEQIVDRVKKEVYDYLFNGKQAQLSLFGAESSEEDSDDNAEDEE